MGGGPLECDRNALEFATANPKATAWFGFRFNRENSFWWFHSWTIQESVYIDSRPPANSPIYAVCHGGWEL